MTEPATESAYERARSGWGFPRFARSFPRDADLDELVVAFARGDYARVRSGAPALAARTEDPAVKQAAETLRAHLEADPVAKLLFAATAVLLAFLTVWWIAHDGPGPERSAPQPVPTVEYVR